MNIRKGIVSGAMIGASLLGPACSSGGPEAGPATSAITPGQAESRSLKLSRDSVQQIEGNVHQGVSRIALGQCLGWYIQDHKGYVLTVNPAVTSVNTPPETFEQIAVLVPPTSDDTTKLKVMPGPYTYFQSDETGKQITSSGRGFQFDRLEIGPTKSVAKEVTFRVEQTQEPLLDSSWVARDVSTGQAVMTAVMLSEKPQDLAASCITLAAGANDK